jgi:tetratricopeptide (TPR) repeat protein
VNNMKKYILLINFFFLSCDFSSRLNKEIILAQESINRQDYEQAIQRYGNILRLNPPKEVLVKIYYQLGDLYSIHHGDPARAIRYYQKLKDVSDDPAWLVKSEEKLADMNFSYLKNFQEAKNHYQNLIEFRPQLPNFDLYQLRLALCFLELNERQKALELFKRIGQDDRHQYQAISYYYIGILYFQNKEWKTSLYYWNEYIKREKRKDKIIQTKFLMANAYESMEFLDEAYQSYYALLGEYPQPELIKERLKSLYARRTARKR